MSLQLAAQHLASRGRGDDSVLVHMTPGEVRGLQNLAMAHGGQLTINPETGLPEAGFLSSILPTLLGVGATVFSGGAITPLMAGLGVGAFQTARTGDIGKGLMAGFGAYSGANLAGALSSVGEAGLQAATAAPGVEAIKALDAAAAQGMAFPVDAEATRLLQQQVAEKAASLTPYDKLMAGASSLQSEAGRQNLMTALGGAKGALQTAAGIAGPIAAERDIQSRMPKTVTQMTSPTARITPYRIDRFGNMASAGSFTPEEFTQRGGFASLYNPPPGGAEGGATPFAEGGVAFESGNTPSYQRASMSPGMLDFAQRSEPVVRMADGGVSDPTQRATPTAAQLAAQQSILADPVKAAREAALSGIAQGLTDQQIADMVNAQYGKTFDAQNVADFMQTQGITRPAPKVVEPPVITPVTEPSTPTPTSTAGTTYGGNTTTPTYTPATVTPTYGTPFQPAVQTMEQVRSGYEQGGGSTTMPTIGTVAPSERIYTQNRVYKALTDYLRDNPNAVYGDVAKLAKELGVPEQQLRAAVNEYRFSGGLSGGSKQAYDYLMGRGEAPVSPFVPGGGPIMRSYREVVGLPTTYEGLKPANLVPSGLSGATASQKLTAPSGAQLTEAERSALGNTFMQAQQSGNYTGFNAMLQSLRLTADDLAKLFPSISRNAIDDAVSKGYVKFYEEPIYGGKAGGLMGAERYADGGPLGVTYGTPFEEAAGIAPRVGGMPTQFDELVKRYTAAAPVGAYEPIVPATAPVAAPAPPAQTMRNPALEEILNRPRPTVQQEMSRLAVPTRDDTQARAAYEQKLASQMKPEEFKGLQESPYSVLNPAFNAQVEASLRGREALQQQGIPSVFGRVFSGGVEDIQPWLSALELERPMGGQITENRDLRSLLNEYMSSALAGNVSRAQGARSRMNTLGLSEASLSNMVNALDPEFNDKIYNLNFNPETKTATGPLGYYGFERYFSPGSGGWSLIAQDKARYGLKDEDIAYGLGVSTKEVQDALASVPAQYKKWPPTGMARGGLADIAAAAAARGGNVEQYNLGGYSDGGRLLRGPGDGVSDSIPAVIGNKQPARLADGEFVVPARIVSELGNGSTEAGARKLYAMMDRVQAARKKSIGKGKVAKNSRADKYLPA